MLDHIQIVVTDPSELTAGRDFAVYSGRTWRVSDLMLKRDLLVAGLGWGYMPEHIVAGDLAAGNLRILRVEGLRDRNTLSLMVIRRRDRLLGPAAQWILARFLARSAAAGGRGKLRRDRHGSTAAAAPRRRGSSA